MAVSRAFSLDLHLELGGENSWSLFKQIAFLPFNKELYRGSTYRDKCVCVCVCVLNSIFYSAVPINLIHSFESLVKCKLGFHLPALLSCFSYLNIVHITFFLLFFVKLFLSYL
jgi:hypothetical protein